MTQSTTKRTDAEVLRESINELCSKLDDHANIDRTSAVQIFCGVSIEDVQEAAKQVREAFAATERAAIQPAGEAVRSQALESELIMNDPAYRKTIAQQDEKGNNAVVRFQQQCAQATAALKVPIQQDEKAGQVGIEGMAARLAAVWNRPAAPEGKTEASELPPLPEQTYSLMTGYTADQMHNYGQACHALGRGAAVREYVENGTFKAARPPVTSVGSIGDNPQFVQLLRGFIGTDGQVFRDIVAYIDARPPDAEAIRSAALEEAANAICTLARRFTTDYSTAVTDAVHAIRALKSRPSPAVKSAEPDYRDLYEKCKREKAAAYERLAKYEDVKMVKSAEPTGGAA